MADTGSEMAEGTTRGTTGAVSRMLEQRLMMRRTSGPARTDDGDIGTRRDSGDVEVGIRCPERDLDARADEVMEALERTGLHLPVGIDDEAHEIRVAVGERQADRALRALERLSAGGRSGFSLSDVDNLDALEALAGRRTVGADRANAPGAAPSEPVESVALTFANHPDIPDLDARQARAYAARMEGLGFDAAYREIRVASRGAGGATSHETSAVVGVSYLTSERDSFVLASGVALHEVGAAGPDDPFAGDREELASARRELVEGADGRRASFEANREAIRNARPAARGGFKGRTARDGGKASDLTADEYEALPARERARMDPSRVPEGAFGRQSAREVAHEQAGVARAARQARVAARSHPHIGER